MTTTWKSYAEETYTLENILRYDKSFKGGHDLNVMVGYNEYFYKQYEHKQQKKGLIDPSISVPDAPQKCRPVLVRRKTKHFVLYSAV